MFAQLDFDPIMAGDDFDRARRPRKDKASRNGSGANENPATRDPESIYRMRMCNGPFLARAAFKPLKGSFQPKHPPPSSSAANLFSFYD